jgi:hypothetical protein
MATGKKSFIAYADWKNTFDELENEDAGALIKHIFAYVNDEDPKSESVLIRAIFANIKSTLKRDLDKWDTQLLQRSEAGKRSAELRALNKLNDRSTLVESRARNPTDSVSVSDSVNDKVININTALPFSFMKSILDLGANKDLVTDWIKVRKNKKATNSETAFNGFKNQYELTGLNIDQVLTECIEKSWSGFKAEWMINNNTNNKKQTQNELTRITNEIRNSL